ncbi:MAG: acyltransferase [Clostridium sp.]|nr:acyltransferase [Clostridium sp.]MCM1547042.1 acyltransferase [Ruminococcus sp.]
MENKRQSGIELLRIILLIQIVFLHICDYGGYEQMAFELEGRQKLLYLAQWLMCRCPVPLLFMLSGYFSVEKKIDIKKNLKKGFHVNNTMMFYSISITALCIIAGILDLNINGLTEIDEFDVIRAFFPFFNRTWFFMTNYLIVMFLSPYLNMFLSALDKKQYGLLTGVLFFLFTIWTNLTKIKNINKVFALGQVVVNEAGKSLYMAVFLYILGGYVKRFTKEKHGTDILPLVGFFALWGLNLFLTCNAEWYEKLFKRSDNPIVIIQCVLLILFFRSLNFSSKIVNTIARSNIAVYLIHENPLMRDIIWEQFSFLKTPDFYQQSFWIYLLIVWGICIGVYAVCNIIDQIRLVCIKATRTKHV